MKKSSLWLIIGILAVLAAVILVFIFTPLSKNLFGGKSFVTTEKQEANPKDITKSYSELVTQVKDNSSFQTTDLTKSELDMLIYKAKKDGQLDLARKLENLKYQSNIISKVKEDSALINQYKHEVEALNKLIENKTVISPTAVMYVKISLYTSSETLLSFQLDSDSDMEFRNFTIYSEAYKDASLKSAETQVYINGDKTDFESTQEGGFLSINLQEPLKVGIDDAVTVEVKEISKGISGIKGFFWDAETASGIDLLIS